MPDIIRKLIMLCISTLALWVIVGLVAATGIEELLIAVVILGFLGSMALWIVFGLEQIGIITPETTQPAKAKRDAANGEDARLALMLSLMTPDERDELKTRLADELRDDGEAIPLADLLAEQDNSDTRTNRA
ncbi:MAG: hypothetical protein JXA10_09120 [Anaerolineae bacterium]|nr:hypothetical protein [Anaerolineae bacterium]